MRNSSGVFGSSADSVRLAILPTSVSSAGGHDDGATAAGGDVRAGINHVHALGQRRVRRQRRWMFGDGQRFAGERGLGDFERRGFEQARIGAHGVAGGEQQHVAGHEFARLDALLGAAAQDARVQGGELAQRRHRALRAPFLKRADERVQDHDDKDDARVAALTDDEGNRRRDEEDVDERARELTQHNG